MKRILLMVLCSSAAIMVAQDQGKIVEYNSEHKQAVMEIAFQDPYKLFGGASAVERGLMSRELFESENKKGMEAMLQDPLCIKKVFLVSGRVAGFIKFYKMRTASLESLKKMAEKQGVPFDENLMMRIMPSLKKTDAECVEYAKIMSIAVSQEHRGKGYGTLLLADALAGIKQRWPQLTRVELDVNQNNTTARHLYESQGFTRMLLPALHIASMGMETYEKDLTV